MIIIRIIGTKRKRRWNLHIRIANRNHSIVSATKVRYKIQTNQQLKKKSTYKYYRYIYKGNTIKNWISGKIASNTIYHANCQNWAKICSHSCVLKCWGKKWMQFLSVCDGDANPLHIRVHWTHNTFYNNKYTQKTHTHT